MAKTRTSTEVKRRYNNKVYLPIHAELPKDLVIKFRSECEKLGISQAKFLKYLIENYFKEEQ